MMLLIFNVIGVGCQEFGKIGLDGGGNDAATFARP
jgi:hypothetical protein